MNSTLTLTTIAIAPMWDFFSFRSSYLYFYGIKSAGFLKWGIVVRHIQILEDGFILIVPKRE